MDLASIIVTALVLGAAAGVKSVAEQSIKDCYEGLKSLLKARYPSVSVDIELLEQKPSSPGRRRVVEEILVDIGADKDEEVLLRTRDLLDAINNLGATGTTVTGIELEDIQAASLAIKDIVATRGTGLKIRHSTFDEMTISQVRAGPQEDDPKGRKQ